MEKRLLPQLVRLLYIYQLVDALNLQPKVVDVWENSSTTITCTNNGFLMTAIRWFWNDDIATMGYSEGACTVYRYLKDRPDLFNYSCSDGKALEITLKSLTKERHNENWICKTNNESEKSNLVKVLIKVPVENTVMRLINYIGTVMEDDAITLECNSSECRPAPKFSWYLDNGTSWFDDDILLSSISSVVGSADTIQIYSAKYVFRVNRTFNGMRVFCAAENFRMVKKLSTKTYLNITYPADGPPEIIKFGNGSTYNVLIETTFHFTCSVTGGNPLPTLTWNSGIESKLNVSGKTVENEISWKATVGGLNTLQCTSSHIGGKDNVLVYLNVLYPPNTPLISILVKNGEFKAVESPVLVVNDTSFTLRCTADSNPPVRATVWKGVQYSNNEILFVQNIRRSQQGNVTCQVNNMMEFSEPFAVINGSNSSNIVIEVLFSPTLGLLTNETKIEGENITKNCHVLHSNPVVDNFTWTFGNVLWTGDTLKLTDVRRQYTGYYRCHASNLMKPSDGEIYIGSSSSSFYLDIQYKTEITEFKEANHEADQIVVEEKETLTVTCKIDGNPRPTGEINFQVANFLEINNAASKSLNVSLVTSKSLQIVRKFEAQCIDSGNYTCIGSNVLYNQTEYSTRQWLTIYVKCSPRQSPLHIIDYNVSSSTLHDATLSFKALAYPIPNATGYIWSKETDTEGHWSIIDKSDSKYAIVIVGLTSELTIKNISEKDFGLYNVVIENEVGRNNFTFHLIAAGKPNPPENFRYIYSPSREANVVLIWKPGFNGGLNQTFIIRWCQTHTEYCYEHNIPHNDKPEMNYTVVNLIGGTNYEFEIYARNLKGNSSSKTITVITKHLLHTTINDNVIGGAVGGTASVLFVVVVLIIALYMKLRMSQNKNDNTEIVTVEDQRAYENISKEMFEYQQMREHVSSDSCNASTVISDPPDIPLRNNKRKQSERHESYEALDFDEYDDGIDYGVYGNASEIIKCIERLHITELLPYVKEKTSELFRLQYMKLPRGLIKPYEDSQRPENIGLNRYHGVYPYDHSRVRCPEIPGFYINASYIDGYTKEKEYIASLGPLSRTSNKFELFWQMVWYEQSDVVVMLTKLKEPSGVKCEQYWPDEGYVAYGDVTVSLVTEVTYADYVNRKFVLQKGSETRNISQLHFMAWPDKSVPEDITSLLDFMRTIRSIHSNGPLIVHCSAGIGRTGTLIALDILIEEGNDTGFVDVLSCVRKMRDQRTSMVQTAEQYHFIYKALVSAIVLDSEFVKADEFQTYHNTLQIDWFEEMYQKFTQTIETDNTQDSNARTLHRLYKDKNRVDADIPGDSKRVVLHFNRDSGDSDYINAVYVDSFSESDFFIVTQSPLRNCVEDFLCLVYQSDCLCIVSMDGELQGQMSGMYIPPEKSFLVVGDFKISSERTFTENFYIAKKLRIELKDKGGEKTLYHFHYTGWLDGHKTPNSAQSFVKFVCEVSKFVKEIRTQSFHILVQCLNAFERSCLFCAVMNLNQRVDIDGEVCVANTLRRIRTRRKNAFPNLEQFQFCFEAVSAYLSMNEAENNKEENTYLNLKLHQ